MSGANNWRLLKNVQKEKGSHESHDVIGVYSRFTRSPVGPPRFEVGAKILIRLTMSICYPAGNLPISQCSSANTVGSIFQPGPAELVTNDVQIMLRGSILLNQNQIRPRDDDQHFNHSAYGIERTSSAGNNTNYIGKRKEIRIPLR